MGERTEVFAEAEGADALRERGAAAAKEALEEGFELEGAGDVQVDFGDFSGGEFSPARADRDVFAKAVEEEFDFGEGETHFASVANQQNTMEGVAGIAALTAEALGRSEKAHFFIVTDGGGVEAGAAGEFTDFHFGSPKNRLT